MVTYVSHRPPQKSDLDNSSDVSIGTSTQPINRRRPKILRFIILISLYRIANAWMIRTQFDPDEYWQTLEPAYCLAFGSVTKETSDASSLDYGNTKVDGQHLYGCALTWEWTRRWTPSSQSSASSPSTPQKQTTIHDTIHSLIEQAMHGPVRSYVSILPTYWYYLGCRYLFRWVEVFDAPTNNVGYYLSHFHAYLKHFVDRHASYIISKGPAFVNAVLVAAPTDLSVWLIASHLSTLDHSHIQLPKHKLLWPFWALFCSLASWFHGYALSRTYANSFETVCLLVGVALLCPELFGDPSVRQTFHRPQKKLAFVLGGLSACVRFTTLAAWIPLGLIISFRSGCLCNKEGNTQRVNYKSMIDTLFGICAMYGAAGVVIGCIIDRYFYGFWAIPLLGNFHFNVVLGK